jgi:hypothetical protein
MVRDFEQCTMSTSKHETTGAFGTGPSARYTPLIEFIKFSSIIALFSMFILYGATVAVDVTNILLLFF